MKYQAEFWYCHESDPRPIREWCCNMMAAAQDGEHARETARELQGQGYIVQRVLLLTLCEVCQGQGRIQWKPRTKKGLCTYTDCATCKATGVLNRENIPIN